MAAAFSPDGKTVLTGSLAQTTQRWDATTGRLIGKPMEHDDFYMAAFSPDGRTGLSLQLHGRMARLWDLTSNQPIGLPWIASENSQVGYVVFSPDSKMVLTEAWMDVGLWDAATGQPIGKPWHVESGIGVLAFSPDGKTVLSGSAKKTAQLWSAVTGKPIGRPLVHEGDVLAVTFSPDGRTILTGSADCTARLWDAGSGRPISEPMQHEDVVSAVAFSPDGKTVLTGSADKTARLWDAEIGQYLGKPLDIEPDHAMNLTGVAVSPDGKTILSGSWDKTARFWDATTGQAVGKPLRHPQAVFAVAFSPDGKTILTAGRDNIGRLWDAGTGQVVGKPMQLQFMTFAVRFSPDGKTVLIGDKLWDATTCQPIGKPLNQSPNINANAVAFSPDGRNVLGGSRDGRTQLWDVATGQPIGEPLNHRGGVRAVAFSPDGRTICTGSGDRTACLWDAVSGRLIGSRLEHQAEVLAVAFSPDGKLLLTGSADKTARLWDVATGQPIGRPMEHRAEVEAVAFSPDGKTFLIASPHSATTLEHYGAAIWLWKTPLPVYDDVRRTVAWVETETGLKLDSQGSVHLLDNNAWRQSREQLNQLGGLPSTDNAQLLDPILFGPDPAARADGLMNLGRFAEADAAYAEAIRARPLNKSARSARGRFYLSYTQPQRAATVFAEAVRLWPDDFFLRERLCLALRAAGDESGLKKAIAGLLERFGNPIDFDEASRVAFTCVLAPDAVADPEIAIRLARSAVRDASAANKAFPLATLGAALYRAGRIRRGDPLTGRRTGLVRGPGLPGDVSCPNGPS